MKEKGESRPKPSTNELNHKKNLLIAHGRVHGTVYLEGKPRKTQDLWLQRRSMRRITKR